MCSSVVRCAVCVVWGQWGASPGLARFLKGSPGRQATGAQTAPSRVPVISVCVCPASVRPGPQSVRSANHALLTPDRPVPVNPRPRPLCASPHGTEPLLPARDCTHTRTHTHILLVMFKSEWHLGEGSGQ